MSLSPIKTFGDGPRDVESFWTPRGFKPPIEAFKGRLSGAGF
jgi:hypothetical protein